jgi:prepilin signal peptidase PulO-like enzyme (type II secretory pathway)
MSNTTTPKSLKIIRALAYVAMAVALALFFTEVSKILTVSALVYYALCIVAIDKKNKILFTILTAILCLLALVTALTLIFLGGGFIDLCRFIIEGMIIWELVKHRNYFSK